MVTTNPTKVLIVESEQGWGSKVDEVKEFSTLDEATQYVKDYNNKHNPPSEKVPSWYMYTRLAGSEEYGMLR